MEEAQEASPKEVATSSGLATGNRQLATGNLILAAGYYLLQFYYFPFTPMYAISHNSLFSGALH